MAKKDCIRTCSQCGVEFSASHGRARYCSAECRRVRDRKRGAAFRARVRGTCSVEGCAKPLKASGMCGAHYMNMLRHGKPVRQSVCGCCGSSFSVSEGGQGPARYCSTECTDSVRRARWQRASSGRRALYGKGENIDPIAVFVRDKWTCQLCGKRTPERLRGKMVPDAPELDHIIPLAMGGSHTWGNVQCACRECNGKKGATVQGQLGLPLAA